MSLNLQNISVHTTQTEHGVLRAQSGMNRKPTPTLAGGGASSHMSPELEGLPHGALFATVQLKLVVVVVVGTAISLLLMQSLNRPLGLYGKRGAVKCSVVCSNLRRAHRKE